MKYSVYLLSEGGEGSYLAVKDRSEWSKTVAIKHAKGIIRPNNTCILEGVVEVWVEDEFGEIVKDIWGIK